MVEDAPDIPGPTFALFACMAVHNLIAVVTYKLPPARRNTGRRPRLPKISCRFPLLMEHIDKLHEYLRDFVQFGYLTGWRKGEIASLRWTDVEGDVVRLRGQNAKNDEGRSVTLSGDL
jgi:integrase